MPVRLVEAALALEDIVPRVVNATRGMGTCPAVVAVVDRFESCTFEEETVPSIPEVGGPIVSLQRGDTTEAVLDTWLAKGTLLGTDGAYSVFVAFMEVMRRPLQGSWTASTLTVLGTEQSVASLLEELELELQTPRL
jgi:hypothetical protein